jgi:hypothetical protein
MQTPRRLTTHQKAVLIQVLLAFPDQQVAVLYHPAASDALAYAQDFLSVFNAIGWNVNSGAAMAATNGHYSDLAFVVGGQGSLPPGAEALRDALRIYNIQVATLSDLNCGVPPGSFVLTIGLQA